jgi:hypothetical protein
VSDFASLFLTIHILTAIVAFGPNFALPLIARMAAQEPQHGLFAIRLTDRIERRLVLPLALTMPVSGGLLVWAESIDLAQTHWLLLAIGLYVVVVAFAIGVQLRTIGRMIEVGSRMAAGGPGQDAGPRVEMAALGVRARNGGFFLMLMVVVIVSLMAGKPGI